MESGTYTIHHMEQFDKLGGHLGSSYDEGNMEQMQADGIAAIGGDPTAIGLPAPTKLTAWDLIGTESLVRIKGGRTVYEQVAYNAAGNARNVRLSRLDTTNGDLHQVNRYVDPDTEMEVVAES